MTLLETKNFEELSQDERSVVLSEMDETEYGEQRKMILLARDLAKNEKAKLLPNPQTLVLAREKLPKKRAAGFLIFQHKVPTWAAVAACLFIFFGIREINKSLNSNIEPTVITETIHDTVFTEKIITEQLLADTIVKYVYVQEPTEKQVVEDNSTTYSQPEPSFENLHFREDAYCNIMSCYESKKGVSAANDEWLKLVQNGL